MFSRVAETLKAGRDDVPYQPLLPFLHGFRKP